MEIVKNTPMGNYNSSNRSGDNGDYFNNDVLPSPHQQQESQ